MISITDANHNRSDAVLRALADPTRRRIVELLGEAPRTATELHRAFPIAGSAVSRHLRVLRETGVVVEQRIPEDGRVRLYALEPAALRELATWLDAVSATWQRQLEAFRDHVALRGARP